MMYMNNYEKDILNIIYSSKFTNQRHLSKISGYSLGIVNKSLKCLKENEYLDDHYEVTSKTINLFSKNKVNNAIILAAVFGMRMVPINTETSKGLIEIKGEKLIERLIKQLHEKNIFNIYIVVGFMKEQYEYLIDEYNVKLIVNSEYAHKNNLNSVKLASNYISNSYIIPCDLWCRYNPFHSHELYSWYMVENSIDNDSTMRVNRKNELIPCLKNGNKMIVISYLHENDIESFMNNLNCLCENPKNNDSFWEEALSTNNEIIVSPNVINQDEIIEINTYEQLRELDSDSNNLQTDAIETIKSALNTTSNEIKEIQILKKGMTNRSFLFTCKNEKYIMRIPGEGTDQLINRKQEANVYEVIKKEKISDPIIYINPNNGYKITKYLENARVCDPLNEDDLKKCMKKLKDFHLLDLKVDHEFNLFDQIEFYESLWKEKSVFRDYEKVKEKIFNLKKYVNNQQIKKCLTHIDAVPDNFLFSNDDIYLIDWEYAGMQDPHVDLAMFSIYSFYDKEQIDHLIDIYFDNQCEISTRIKIYCYVAICGLLWSNWCEYKRQLGVEFGEYSLRQYRYAKDYIKIVENERTKVYE